VLSADAASNLTITPGGSFTTADTKMTVSEVSGSVEARIAQGRQLAVNRGSSLPAGALIQTKSASEAKDVTTPDRARFLLAAESGATIGPPPDAPTGDFSASLVQGSVTFDNTASFAAARVRAARSVLAAAAAPASSGPQRVQTPTVGVHARDADCAGSATFSQSGLMGSTVVDVTSGTCDVIDRQGRITTLVAGTSRAFDELVPRVTLVLPANHGSVRRSPGPPNRVRSLLVWTAFPGAAGYLLEYAASPAETFAVANATAVERPGNALELRRGPDGVTIRLPGMSTSLPVIPEIAEVITYREADGLVQLEIALGTPVGAQAFWRVFPLDASGAIVPGATASDSHATFVE
jgi:hypothetical protein